MNENPLPTLKAGDSHMESLIEAAIQGHADTREAMRWLVRQLVPATQPAGVTDEQILEATLHIPYPREDAFPDEWQQYEIAVARAILALRPVQVPMTDEQADALATEAFGEYMCDLNDDIELALVRKVEAHHGIKPKEQA